VRSGNGLVKGEEKMVKRKINWKVYLVSAIITLIIFSLGVGLSFFLSDEKYDIIRYDLEEMKLKQMDMELELMLMNSIGKESCDTLKYEIEKMASLNSELEDKVNLYDNEMITNPDFHILKKQYMMSLIEFWSYLELYKKNCNSSVNTILYFYSIDDCNDCQAQGFVLSYLKEEYPEDIMVFALDKNEDLYSMDLVKNVYNITEAPTLIINNEKHEGLKDINQLKEILIL
jgi:glutaredoxin